MLAALGAYHGINPGMGWLFAVALGLQEQSRIAVFRAFFPIALGHAVSVSIVVAVVVFGQSIISPDILKIVGASILVAFGLYKLLGRIVLERIGTVKCCSPIREEASSRSRSQRIVI